MVVAPVEGSDELTADLFSNIMYYVYEKGNADYIVSEAFEHALKTGLAIVFPFGRNGVVDFHLFLLQQMFSEWLYP